MYKSPSIRPFALLREIALHGTGERRTPIRSCNRLMSNNKQVVRRTKGSTATVSRIGNNYLHVSDSTRRRALGAMQQFNHPPNRLARRLCMKRTETRRLKRMAVATLLANNEKRARDATEYLVRCGHRKMGLIAEPRSATRQVEIDRRLPKGLERKRQKRDRNLIKSRTAFLGNSGSWWHAGRDKFAAETAHP
jgi:DNA-binding LacI/PurR family transcriptional regulator